MPIALLHDFSYRVLRKISLKFGFILIKQEFEGIVTRLDIHYGYGLTKQFRKPIDINQEPCPWFTYPAIEFISQLDLSNKSIFEWGSGNSSLFFAKRAASIISVESNPDWYDYVAQNLLENQKLFLRPEESFAEAIEEFNNTYDVIIIDSLRRYDCAKKAISFLNEGGVIILDNSDWHPNTSAMLRQIGNLIEVDMHGFSPINDYSSTTSFYFHRNFNFQPIQGVQPHFSKSAFQQVKDGHLSQNNLSEKMF